LEITMMMHRTSVLAILLVNCGLPAFAQPGGATLRSPSADVVGSTIAFSWDSVPTATWYHFWLGKADASLVLEQWYTAEHAGCAGGGTCTIVLTPPLTAGGFTWHIRTWSASGYGPWSAPHMFTMRDIVQAWGGTLPPSRRFTLAFGGQAAVDNETGLAWQRTPSATPFLWAYGSAHCTDLTIGARRGWRLPTVSELQSLVDATRTAPSLPAGHPFTVAINEAYWTSTPATFVADSYYGVHFNAGHYGATHVSMTRLTWCVRGGS
jgi:hypothetical protein